MAMSEPETPVPPPPAAGMGERIHAARFVLAAATLVLFGGVVFGLPILYALAGAGLVVLVAGLAPRRRVVARGALVGSSRYSVWPDTSMKATVEALPHPAFLLDAGGVARYRNARAAELFPATRPGDPFALTFRRPEVAAALELAGRGSKQTLEFNEPGRTTNVYAMHVSPLATPAGTRFVLVTFDDVSDRLALARMRADFVANASHELRTPLASLTGFIETLLGPARNDPAATEKFLRIMLEQAWRMRRLIDDLLSLSRAEMRARSRPTGEVDLAGVVGTAVDAMQPLAAESGVVLSTEVPDRPVRITGDHDELVQVAQNLVENAIRYGGEGGKVDVRLATRAADGRAIATIEVRDYGPGIAAEHLPRLTERFYRVDVGASRERKGTGLGLAIVKHIMTRHQGQLDIRSTPGEGASFTMVLPLQPDSAAEK